MPENIVPLPLIYLHAYRCMIFLHVHTVMYMSIRDACVYMYMNILFAKIHL